MKVSVTKQIEIAAAHFQPGYRGACQFPHGHNWLCEVTAYGDTGDVDGCGMLLDLSTIKLDLQGVVGLYDHTLLNDFYETPSLELLAADWLERLHRRNPMYRRLRVWENPRSSCEVWIDGD